ncbi:MAG: carbohydrate ABC transporter permease [Erysipelotrichaceae bacterium]|nr:carbohydrate ABC transporter permease [Erysipelotrichaceae bacterium]MBR2599555.1 carbohydrate ABC transporter permease [Erysipelotrichaceae bacterium]
MKKDLNKTAGIKLFISRVVVYGILIFLSFLCLFFFYLMFINASRSNAQLQAGFTLIPGGNALKNFVNAWHDTNISIPIGMKNSFIVASLSAILTSYFSALTAYGTYVYDFRFKKAIHLFILAIMMIPSQVSAVGFIQLAFKYHLTNKLWMLIIPSIAAPSVYFYMRQYLEATLPLEMVEAARIDGSNEFKIFNQIVLPIMKPAIAVQMIFSFVGSWNNYFMPALLLNDIQKKTVPVMIATLRSADFTKFDMGKVYMLMVMAILPVMVIYVILSKSIIKGVTSGSVKG